jgi:5-methylcytosine-specific restriction protein B
MVELIAILKNNYDLDLSGLEIDGYFAKKITLSSSRSIEKDTRGAHIEITDVDGPMNFFPIVTSAEYLENNQTLEKRRYTLKVPLIILKENLDSLYSSYNERLEQTDFTPKHDSETIQERINNLDDCPEKIDSHCINTLNRRSTGQWQTEIGTIRQDGQYFTNLRDVILPKEILLFLKVNKSNSFLYYCLGLEERTELTDFLDSNGYSQIGNIEENIELKSILEPSKQVKGDKLHLNSILYGPPGTGKTYSTITRAVSILGLIESKDDYTEEEYSQAQELFKKECGNRIEFVTMHQSYSYEDFIEGLKPIKDENSNNVQFDYIPGVFKRITDRCFENRILKQSANKNPYFPSFMLSVDEDYVREEIYSMQNNGDSGMVAQRVAFDYFNNLIGKKYTKAWRDKFDRIVGGKSPRAGYSEEHFREGEMENFTALSQEFRQLDEDNRREKLVNEWFSNDQESILTESDDINSENYVIILDEINRCNISKVFGELITLIEDDKRENFEVTLPSSHPFTVPKNLYIIGTMNTADKSIAMVDIALRRRFEFEALYPDPNLISDNDKKSFMIAVNKEIKDRKTIDFQIGHADFMKNFSLVDTINKKTIPLLVEYFRSDMAEVKKILKDSLPKSVSIDNEWFKNKGLIRVE